MEIGALVFVICFISLSHCHEGHDHEVHIGEENYVSGIWKGAEAHEISMEKMTGVDLHWISSDPEWVTMEMKSKTTGYVSVGFCSPWYGTMKGCDIVIGWVAANGTGVIRDCYAHGNMSPEEDESQDYILIKAIRNEYETKIQFKRKWVTLDPQDTDLKTNQVRVIYAWHPLIPINGHIPVHVRNTRGHTLVSQSLYMPSLHSSGSESIVRIKRTIFFSIFIFSVSKF